jgi:hypothetical protein
MTNTMEIRKTVERVLKVKKGPLQEITICSNVIFNSVADLCQLLALLQDHTPAEQAAAINDISKMLHQVQATVTVTEQAVHEARKKAAQ